MANENKPDHYEQAGWPKPVWQMMIDTFGIDQFISFCQLNRFKYRMRAGMKASASAEQDIAKAMEYKELIDKGISYNESKVY